MYFGLHSVQPDGGVLNKTAAEKLLRSLCERQGVLVRDRVVLRGMSALYVSSILQVIALTVPSGSNGATAVVSQL